MAMERAREREDTGNADDPDASTHAYRAFGLHFASVVPIGSFCPAPPAPPDVTVRWGSVPDSLAHATARGPAFDAGGGELLLRPPDGLRILIRDGREIVIDRTRLGEDPRLESWLSTSALGALLHQRGLFLLHASAIAVDDEVVLFTGDRGAGKSTLLSALAVRGYPAAADDVVAITLEVSDDAVPLALPGLTRAKLRPESAAMLGLDLRDCPQVEPELGKHFVTWPAAPERKRRIRAIYVLRVDAVEAVTFERLSPLRAVEAMISNIYRPQYAGALRIAPRSLRTVTALGRHAVTTQICRPIDGMTVHAIADHVVASEGVPP